MKVILGECSGRMAERLQARGWGRCWIAHDRRIRTYPGEPWILDNGVFRDYRRGRSWFDSSSNRWLRALRQAQEQGTPPLGVVAPDIVGGGADSLERSVAYVERFTPGAVPWWLAVQDGMTPEMVEPELEHFDGIFLGGTNAWKAREGGAWAELAKRHGKHFHYARCGTPEKVRHAKRIGADSIDSAFPMWSLDRFRHFETVVRGDQQELELAA